MKSASRRPFVIVYSNRRTFISGPDAWRAWRGDLARATTTGAGYDDLVTAFIETGTFESACADAECPDEERRTPLLARLRHVSEELGMAVACASNDDTAAASALACARGEGALVTEDLLPRQLTIGAPEGYAYYSLFPESYAAVVDRWAIRSQPPRVVCIGVRSIGTSLSAIVTAALRRRGIEVTSWTVRPHGHPFDRHVRLSSGLVEELNLQHAVVLIVDEGPGLSGSSFAGTADAVSRAGVPDERVIFVASHAPDVGRLRSPAGRARWHRHPSLIATFDSPCNGIEISAGAWRNELMHAAPWPAIHPAHERRKYLARDGSSISRFAGLGRFGEDAGRRSELLYNAGWTPEPSGLSRGFLAERRVAAPPLQPRNISAPFLTHVARYIAWLRKHASEDRIAPVDALASMLRINAPESLGEAAGAAAERLASTASDFAEPATAVDGRLCAHEWLPYRSSWIKTDALDHHHDHFFPGCAVDAAWDVAGAIVELAPRPAEQTLLIDEYVRASGDRGIHHRLPFYRAAYVAFRTGYCSLAAETLRASKDGERFEALAGKYREELRATLAPSAH
jgi:hypothetical protein